MLLIISICVFAYAAYRLVLIYMAYKTGADEYKELRELFSAERIIRSSDDEEDENEWEEDEQGPRTIKSVMENPVDFDSLCAINSDVIGWLEMEAIPSISYPMVQGEDNDYYLHRTFQRTDNFAGSIFIDYMNKKDFSDHNTIIYGHNMKDGSMFGVLKNYRDPNVYDKSPYFWIYTPDYIYKYQISTFEEVPYDSPAYQIVFDTNEDFQEYLYRMQDMSEKKTGVELTGEDEIVTLSTCTGNEATRFIVQGKKIETYRSIPKSGGYDN